MDKALRNTLRNVVTQCRKLLEDSIADTLEGQYGVYRSGKTDADAAMVHLSPEDREVRERILIHLKHIQSGGFKDKDAVEQLTREVAYTHLNRLSAYKMMEKRGLIREAVSRGVRSQGLSFYLADHPDDEALHDAGKQDVAYRHYLTWQGAQFSDEIGVLFAPTDLANALFPPQRVLDEVLERINSEELKDIWAEDEAVGWIYQYFTPKELRDKARAESQAPRNSYELSFRNQFFTPRYVVEFLTDNTLGRIWYEMLKGDTALTAQCRYLVRLPDEVFLSDADDWPVNDDSRFIRGEINDITPFDLPMVGYVPPQPSPNNPKVVQIGYPTYDQAADRLMQFAYYVRPFDWSHDPRLEGWQKLLVDLASGAPNDPIEGKTQDLWDCLLAIARSERFNEGVFAQNIQALTRIANEIARRIADGRQVNLSQEALLRSPVLITHRPYKDPRRLRVLDPACGSGHFLLYAFDLLAAIYEEAWERDLRDQAMGSLRADYPTLDALRLEIPRLILANNLHGIDIDARATQIAALALWLRAQRYYQAMGLKRGDERPKITRGNIVCAEPMPGDSTLLDEFSADLQPKVLGQLVRAVFNKMKLAGEAGSLLKIEEELQDAIEAAKKQYIREQAAGSDMQTRALFPDLFAPQATQLSMFDLSDIDDAAFFDQAEKRVLDALHEYARQATNGKGLQRQLFADDAARGFAFIDVCRKRYDVVLMNPPFGAASLDSRENIDLGYPTGKYDLGAAFIVEATNRLLSKGFIGVIANRTIWFLKRLANFRKFLSTNTLIHQGVDMGLGVLDATVEVGLLTLEMDYRRNHYSSWYQVTDDRRREDLLRHAVNNPTCEYSYVRPMSVFEALENCSFAYWLPADFLKGLQRNKSAQEIGFETRQGLATRDNERFLRLLWEVSPGEMGKHWRFYSKGGSYQPIFGDYHLVIDWSKETQENEYKQRDAQLVVLLTGRKTEYEFRPGITYPTRTSKFFSKAFPSGCIFDSKGSVVFHDDVHLHSVNTDVLWLYCLILNTDLVQFFLDAESGAIDEDKARSYTEGLVERVPLGENILLEMSKYKDDLQTLWSGLVQVASSDDTSPFFRGLVFTTSLASEYTNLVELKGRTQASLINLLREANHTYGQSLGLEKNTVVEIVSLVSQQYGESVHSFLDPESSLDYAIVVVHHLLGLLFGRWDIHYATGEKPISELPDPFAALPACPPGMLQGDDGLPLTETPPGYPLDIQWDGILVDDEDHSADVVVRTRQMIDLLWGERADAIEREACDILTVQSLREYFRRSGKGGFWDDHVKRYSKSRRQAPIYWLLQSSKKNYGLWLYYHRLDKDILFKALVNYVEPKIRLEESRLNDLRAQLVAAGNTGSAAKKLAGEVEKQEALLVELDDFHDKLSRAANLNLTPDLNDGVVLNIAPLWELVPWKVAKEYWDELMQGKYEWSTISGQLRDRGLT